MKTYSKILEDLFKPYKLDFVKEFFDRTYKDDDPNIDWDNDPGLIEFKHHCCTYTIAQITEQDVIFKFDKFRKLKVFI